MIIVVSRSTNSARCCFQRLNKTLSCRILNLGVILNLGLLITLMIALIGPIESAHAGHCGACGIENPAILRCKGCSADSYCNETCQRAAWGSHKSFCRGSKALEGGVEIRPSRLPRAGNGLFAAKRFERGEPIAIYLGKTLPVDLKSSIHFGTSTYLQDLPDRGLIVDGDPTPPAAHLGAQLANDPLVTPEEIETLVTVDCTDLSPAGLSFFNEFVKTYYARMLERRTNVELREGFFGDGSPAVFVAQTTINPGDEILYPYGVSYWWRHSAEICLRKGLPEKGIAIERQASIALEEALARETTSGNTAHERIYQAIIRSQNGLYTHEKYHRDLAIVEKFKLEFSLVSLLSKAGTIGFIEPEDDTKNKAFQTAKKYIMDSFGLPDALRTISALPNSEFFDERSYAKIHPKSKELIREFVKFLRSLELDDKSWFADGKTGVALSWAQIIELIDLN